MTDQNGVTVLIGYRRKQCHPQAAEIEGFGMLNSNAQLTSVDCPESH